MATISVSWFGFNTITRVIRFVSINICCYGHISSSDVVLSLVDGLIFLSEGSLVYDDWHVSVQDLGLSSVLSVVFGVKPGLSLGSVVSLLLNSVVSFEHGVISDLFFGLVKDFVFVGVPNLNLLVVGGLRVWSHQVVNFGPPPVLFLFSVENIVVGLVRNDWDVSVVSLGVRVVDGPWNFFVLCEMLDSVEGLVFGGVPLLILSSVLSFRLSVSVRKWDLPCSDLNLNLVCNLVFGLVIGHWNINDSVNLNVVDVSVNVIMVVVNVWKWFANSADWLLIDWFGSIDWCGSICWCLVTIIKRWE